MLLNDPYLNQRGYIVKKDGNSESLIRSIREELKVKPQIFNMYDQVVNTFNVYLENEKKLYLPKFYGLNRFNIKPKIKYPDNEKIDVKFAFNLRDIQKKPAEIVMKAYKEKGGGILHLQCGFGKTIMALYFVSQLKMKTIVIVHKEFLLNQWVERINQSLPGATIGRIQGNIFDVEGKDIVIAMLQTLWRKKFKLGQLDCFGHLIIDECHRIPSEKFSKALQKLSTRYMLGLTATPKRPDGLMKVLKWYIGDIIYSQKLISNNEVNVEKHIIISNNGYNRELNDYRGRVKVSTMINNICYDLSRTIYIVKIISNIIKDYIHIQDRQILILTDRRRHLDDIFNIVVKSNICSVGYYVGGMKKEKLKISESKQLILATYAMAKEGLDIKTLNCLILASPKKDIIQAVGRILRQKHTAIKPLIIDVIDNFSIFRNQAKIRNKLYKNRKYNISEFKYDIDNKNIVN
tara:strand:- start:95 stop:1480 length:1386 start_codon:yes stop_codon:yes gene_type:complete